MSCYCEHGSSTENTCSHIISFVKFFFRNLLPPFFLGNPLRVLFRKISQRCISINAYLLLPFLLFHRNNFPGFLIRNLKGLTCHFKIKAAGFTLHSGCYKVHTMLFNKSPVRFSAYSFCTLLPVTLSVAIVASVTYELSVVVAGSICMLVMIEDLPSSVFSVMLALQPFTFQSFFLRQSASKSLEFWTLRALIKCLSRGSRLPSSVSSPSSSFFFTTSKHTTRQRRVTINSRSAIISGNNQPRCFEVWQRWCPERKYRLHSLRSYEAAQALSLSTLKGKGWLYLR